MTNQSITNSAQNIDRISEGRNFLPPFDYELFKYAEFCQYKIYYITQKNKNVKRNISK